MTTTSYIQCRNCNKLNDKARFSCEDCGAVLKTSKFGESALIECFPSGYFEHIASEPIYIRGRQELLTETRRRGQVSHYAED